MLHQPYFSSLTNQLVIQQPKPFIIPSPIPIIPGQVNNSFFGHLVHETHPYEPTNIHAVKKTAYGPTKLVVNTNYSGFAFESDGKLSKLFVKGVDDFSDGEQVFTEDVLIVNSWYEIKYIGHLNDPTGEKIAKVQVLRQLKTSVKLDKLYRTTIQQQFGDWTIVSLKDNHRDPIERGFIKEILRPTAGNKAIPLVMANLSKLENPPNEYFIELKQPGAPAPTMPAHEMAAAMEVARAAPELAPALAPLHERFPPFLPAPQPRGAPRNELEIMLQPRIANHDGEPFRFRIEDALPIPAPRAAAAPAEAPAEAAAARGEAAAARGEEAAPRGEAAAARGGFYGGIQSKNITQNGMFGNQSKFTFKKNVVEKKKKSSLENQSNFNVFENQRSRLENQSNFNVVEKTKSRLENQSKFNVFENQKSRLENKGSQTKKKKQLNKASYYKENTHWHHLYVKPLDKQEIIEFKKDLKEREKRYALISDKPEPLPTVSSVKKMSGGTVFAQGDPWDHINNALTSKQADQTLIIIFKQSVTGSIRTGNGRNVAVHIFMFNTAAAVEARPGVAARPGVRLTEKTIFVPHMVATRPEVYAIDDRRRSIYDVHECLAQGNSAYVLEAPDEVINGVNYENTSAAEPLSSFCISDWQDNGVNVGFSNYYPQYIINTPKHLEQDIASMKCITYNWDMVINPFLYLTTLREYWENANVLRILRTPALLTDGPDGVGVGCREFPGGVISDTDEGKIVLIQEVERKITQIDQFLLKKGRISTPYVLYDTKQPIPHNVMIGNNCRQPIETRLVYRGMTNRYTEINGNNPIGGNAPYFRVFNYLHTSVSLTSAIGFCEGEIGENYNPIIYRILVTPGIPYLAFDWNLLTSPHYDSECEIMFPRGCILVQNGPPRILINIHRVFPVQDLELYYRPGLDREIGNEHFAQKSHAFLVQTAQVQSLNAIKVEFNNIYPGSVEIVRPPQPGILNRMLHHIWGSGTKKKLKKKTRKLH